MARVKLQLQDNIKRVAFIETDATIGADIGIDLRYNGKVQTLAQLQALFGGGTTTTGSNGTPISSILTTKGDLVTRDANVQRLGIGTTGQALIVVAGLPAWGTVPAIGGGTGFASYAAGDTLYANSTTTLAKLAIGTANQFMRVTGSAPSWASPAALTRTDDTNVTITLGGTPASALMQAVSLTVGWSGTLAAPRGGTGFGSYTAGDLLYASSTTAFSKLAIGTAGDVLRVSGGAPAWQAVSTMAANPSASVGLAAVNGSASTFMRSDAAPALDQGIAPTWSAQHIFGLAGTNATPTILLASTRPYVRYDETGGGTNQRFWNFQASGAQFAMAAMDTTLTTARDFLVISRNGVAITAQQYGNSTDNPVHTFYGQLVLPKAGGASALDYPILLTSTRPGVNFNDTAAAADAGRWEWFVTGGTMFLRTINDASSLARPTMQFVRSASGIAITSQIYGNSTDNPIHLFNGSLSLATIATSTSASIGAATALPALPTGYITVTIGGAAKKIPYYEP